MVRIKDLRQRIVCFVGSGPSAPNPKRPSPEQSGQDGGSKSSSPSANQPPEQVTFNESTGTFKRVSPSDQRPEGSTEGKSPSGDGRRREAREAKIAAAAAATGIGAVNRGVNNSQVLDLTNEQFSAVQKYLRGDSLTVAQKNTLRTVPISQWAKVAQSVDNTSSPLITFAVPPDNILRVTLYMRNSSRKVYSRNVFDNLSGDELYVPPDIQALNPETYNLTFYFAVLENSLNPEWSEILIYFKDLLYSGFYREITPGYINLESIAIKVISPGGYETVNKVYSTFEKGNLSTSDTIEENMIYTYNMYSSVLVSNRNQFQIRLPNVGSNFSRDMLESEIADRLESTIKLLSTNLVYNSSMASGQVVFRLLINTNKRDAVSSFFPVDAIQSIGFTAPRIIKAKKQNGNGNNGGGNGT